jgi:putative transposase
MARRARVFAPGLLYHVIARGNQRQPTFLRDDDYLAYLHRLTLYRERYQVSLHAYCLMPNHVHLLARTGAPPLAKFMQGLQQSYTQWFNRVHQKVGHLFQGRYRAIVCDSDEYLVTLVRYIHLNPVRAGLAPRPELYRYSGHRALITGEATALLDPGPTLRLLGGPAAYARFTEDGVEEGHQPEFYATKDQQVLGSRAFADTVTRQAAEEVPRTPPRQPLDTALSKLEIAVGLPTGVVSGPDRRRGITAMRALVAFVLVRRLGYRLTDVARILERDPAGLSVTLCRFADRLAREERLARTVARLGEC